MRFGHGALLGGMTILALASGGCIHLKGVVLNDRTGQPFRTAVVTVGRPNGIGVLESNAVDNNGKFDFYIGPTDDENLYVYDSSTDPEYTMQKIESSQVSANMKIRLHQANPEMPGLPRIPVTP